MTLGEKIKKYRLMKNLTQKDLGIKVGFSAATADSRIRKYEKDIMAPKNDIRQKIADALDIDLSALSDINIESYDDIMQILSKEKPYIYERYNFYRRNVQIQNMEIKISQRYKCLLE